MRKTSLAVVFCILHTLSFTLKSLYRWAAVKFYPQISLSFCSITWAKLRRDTKLTGASFEHRLEGVIDIYPSKFCGT